MKKFLLFLLSASIGTIAFSQSTHFVTNLNDGGTGSLRDAISTASDGDIVKLSSSLLSGGSDTIILTSGAIDFFKGLTIIGAYNSTDTIYISGNNNGRIFSPVINVSNIQKFVVFDSLALINGSGSGVAYSGIGGAILVQEADSVILRNSVMFNNSSGDRGGALAAFTLGNNSKLNIYNSKIYNNTSNSGGGICAFSADSSKVTIKNSIVSGNSANDFGGGVFSFGFADKSEIIVINSDITNNSSNTSGGGLYSISNNGISKIIVDNSDVSNNNTSDNGGGVYSGGNLSEIYILNSTIDNNSSDDYGGGVYSESNDSSFIYVENSSVTNNYAEYEGGGVFSYSDGNISEIHILNSTIDNNYTDEYGGGVYSEAYDSTFIYIENSSISSNYSSYEGAGIYSYSDDNYSGIQVLNSTINNNYSDENGGGIYTYGRQQSLVNVVNTTLKNNFSGESGGAIYSQSNNFSSTITILNSILKSNQSSYQGGAVSSQGVYSFVSVDSSMILNGISQEGAGIFSFAGDSSVVMINHSSISDNNVLNNAAGIYSVSEGISKVEVENSTMDNNISHNTGGAIYANSGSPCVVNVKNSTFTENTAPESAVIYCHSSFDTVYVSIVNSTIVGNTNTSLGAGVIDLESNYFNVLDITSSIVALNVGGNVYTYSNDLISSGGYNVFSDAMMNGNVATDILGALVADLDLASLDFYGGNTRTMPPLCNSVAISNGNPTDMTNAQNISIIGVRESGAAEYEGPTISVLGETIEVTNNGVSSYQWINCADNQPIFGATHSTFTATQDGSYAVIITTGNCADTSVCTTIATTGLTELQEEDLTVYPNPTNNQFTIAYDGIISNVEMIDITGRVITVEYSAQSKVTTLPNLENGKYFVRMTTDNGSVLIKSIVILK